MIALRQSVLAVGWPLWVACRQPIHEGDGRLSGSLLTLPIGWPLYVTELSLSCFRWPAAPGLSRRPRPAAFDQSTSSRSSVDVLVTALTFTSFGPRSFTQESAPLYFFEVPRRPVDPPRAVAGSIGTAHPTDDSASQGNQQNGATLV